MKSKIKASENSSQNSSLVHDCFVSSDNITDVLFIDFPTQKNTPITTKKGFQILINFEFTSGCLLILVQNLPTFHHAREEDCCNFVYSKAISKSNFKGQQDFKALR